MSDLLFNLARNRCVDTTGDVNTCTLYTFNRISDERYTFVRSDVQKDVALAWLQGEEPSTAPPPPPTLEKRVAALEARLSALESTHVPKSGRIWFD